VASEQLIEAENTEKELAYTPNKTLCVGMARLGQPDQCVIAGTLEELTKMDFGEPLHSLIICGKTHDVEMEMLQKFLIEGSKYDSNDLQNIS